MYLIRLIKKFNLSAVNITKLLLFLILAKDENLRKIIKEIEHLSEDYGKLQQMADIASTLR